jgi:DNA-binding SARP family transcriptional activator
MRLAQSRQPLPALAVICLIVATGAAGVVEFLLLGPVVVRSGGEVLPVRRGKQRAVLAALLLRANRVVALDDLADVLWDGDRPPSAQVTVQNYVKRLRQALGDADRSRISTEPHGYQIRVEPGELDLSRFRDLLVTAQASARDGSWADAATQAADALGLWRGNPLEDVESELLRYEVPRLAEMRLQAQETRIEADLRLGRHAELISELRQLTAAHPLRERFWVLLMLALYHCGRQADALDAYQQARTVLVAELGAEPGAELRAVQQRVLDGARAHPGAGKPTVPHQLPAAVRDFTGRATELAELDRLLGETAGEASGPVLISAIDGTAGVGNPNPEANTLDRYQSVTGSDHGRSPEPGHPPHGPPLHRLP